MCRFPAFKDVDNSPGGRDAGTFPCFHGLSGQVGGDQDILGVPESMAGRQGFVLDDVQRGPGDVSGGEGVGQCFFIDE